MAQPSSEFIFNFRAELPIVADVFRTFSEAVMSLHGDFFAGQRYSSHVLLSKMADVFGENIFDVFEENDDSEKKKKAQKRKKGESKPSEPKEKQKIGEKREMFKPDMVEIEIDAGGEMSAKKAKVEDTIEWYCFILAQSSFVL